MYARAGEQLQNVQKNFFYDKNKALATQELEKAAKQLEVMKAQKVKEENQVFYDRQVVVEREAHFAKISQKDRAQLSVQQARINPSKKEVEEIELAVHQIML